MGRRLEACDLSRGVRGCADEAASKGETFAADTANATGQRGFCCSGTRLACKVAKKIGHQFAADTAASTGERELFVAPGIF